MYYNGSGYLTQSCPTITSNHQVTFVGYTTVNNKSVWILKNSWGPTWGDKGFFYIPIGSNDYCVESYAYTVIPKNYDGSIINSTAPLISITTETFNPNVYLIIFAAVFGGVALLVGIWWATIQIINRQKAIAHKGGYQLL